jgi:hypothetical protein
MRFYLEQLALSKSHAPINRVVSFITGLFSEDKKEKRSEETEDLPDGGADRMLEATVHVYQ